MRIDGALPQQILQILSKSILESLDIGDFIQGRVTSVKDGLLQMRLTDGSSFTAGVPEGMIIQEGALLTLQIGEKAGEQINARIVSRNGDPGQAPAAQDLPAQARTQLQAFGEKATDALVAKVIDLVENNPSLGVDKASFLVANKMEPDKGMQDIIMKLAQKEFQIDGNLSSLKEQLINILTNSETSGSDKAGAGSLINQLILEQGLDQAVSAFTREPVGAANTTRPDGAADQSSLPQTIQNEQARQALNDILLGAFKDAILTGKPLDRETVANMIKSAFEGVKSAFGGINPAKDPLSAEAGSKMPGSVPEDTLAGLMKGLANAREKADPAQKPDPAAVRQAVEKLFEKAFIKADNGIADRVDIGEKVKALKNVLAFTDDAMKLADPKSAQAGLPVVHELQNALQFFNQANTYHTFVQMPLMINNRQTTGELYVMRGKSKRGKIDPNQFTLFISLNTENLGLVETFLNAANRCVTVNFRVDDEKLAGFVKSNYKTLYDALLKKGYKLADMKCRLHADDTVNLLNAEKKTGDLLGINARLDLKI